MKLLFALMSVLLLLSACKPPVNCDPDWHAAHRQTSLECGIVALDMMRTHAEEYKVAYDKAMTEKRVSAKIIHEEDTPDVLLKLLKDGKYAAARKGVAQAVWQTAFWKYEGTDDAVEKAAEARRQFDQQYDEMTDITTHLNKVYPPKK